LLDSLLQETYAMNLNRPSGGGGPGDEGLPNINTSDHVGQDQAARPKEVWPQSLRVHYVSQTFEQCRSNVDKGITEIALKGEIITAASSESFDHTKDWTNEPLPSTVSNIPAPAVPPTLAELDAALLGEQRKIRAMRDQLFALAVLPRRRGWGLLKQ